MSGRIVKEAQYNILDSKTKMRYNRGMFVKAPPEFFNSFAPEMFKVPKTPPNPKKDDILEIEAQFSPPAVEAKKPESKPTETIQPPPPRTETPITREVTGPPRKARVRKATKKEG